jgi:hypothetical protein
MEQDRVASLREPSLGSYCDPVFRRYGLLDQDGV